MSVDPGPLREVAVVSTITLVILSAGLAHRPIFINALLVVVSGVVTLLPSYVDSNALFEVSGAWNRPMPYLSACIYFSSLSSLKVVTCALLLYSSFLSLSPFYLPLHFFNILFEDSIPRKCLLCFWSMNVAASMIFVIITSSNGTSNTIYRKFFHLTVSLIYLSGVFIEPQFINLCGWMLICIFVVIEMLRYYNVPPWGAILNTYLLVFKDEQDKEVLLTPIFLLLGIFLPLLLSPVSPSNNACLYHVAGVASVGSGDSLAAIVGSTIGRIKWPGKKKTVEGSVAMIAGVFFVLWAARPYCNYPVPSLAWCLFASTILSGIEAFVKNVDNILLPLVGYWLL